MPKKRQPIISKVLQETTQSHEVREPLLRKIEKHFGRRVVAFQTSFYSPQAMITDQDANMLEEVLLSSGIRDRLLLVIDSLGGYGLAAERIIRVCRKYSKNDYEVLIPHMAKSAATIICFGAKRIWMGETSELGPVDPQWTIKGLPVSIYNIIKSYETLMQKANRTRGRIEPYLQQLSSYDASVIQQLRQELALSEAMAVQLLKTGMMKGKSVKGIRRAVRIFIDPEQTLEHGRPIYSDQAADCGIMVGKIGINDDIWRTIWELHLRYDYIMHQVGKIVESVDDLYTVTLPRRRDEEA